MKKQLYISIPLVLLLLVGNAQATIWTQTIDPATHAGSTGTITFDDWGYVGPQGRTWNDVAPVNGFGGPAEGNALDPTGGIGQVQHVVTRDHDWASPDANQTITKDLGTTQFTDAYTDTLSNFYKWGYTSPGGSTFSNMRIDYDGDYNVAQGDMSFNFYDYFDYKTDAYHDPNDPNDYFRLPTSLAFQPYALSDAQGWCGSVMQTNPQAFSPMAGQLQFDFAFDVYFQTSPGVYEYSSTEIVKDFKMSSYGTVTVDVNGGEQSFSASAVVNNTNPTGGNDQLANGTTDPNYQNLVSFMGADILDTAGNCGVLSAGWVAGDRGPGAKKFSSVISGVADEAACTLAGGSWQTHAFPGYAFILRADGIRVLEAMDYSQYSDLSDVVTVVDGVAYTTDENGISVPIADLSAVSAVPVPAAVWLFGSGLIGLLGFARRRKLNS